MLILYLLILLLAIVLSRSRAGCVTPVIIFMGAWVTMALLYMADSRFFQMFPYQIPPKAHIVRLGSMVAFLGGTAAVWLLFPRKVISPVASSYSRPLMLLTWIWLAVLGVCAVSRGWIVYQTYGEILGALPRVRNDFVSGALIFPRFTGLATLAANLCALNLGVLFGQGRRVWMPTGLFLVLAIINDAAMADKGGLRLIILLGLTCYYTRTLLSAEKFRGYTKYVLAGLAAFCLYSAITYFRVEDQSATMLEVSIKHFYGNIAGNIGSSAWFLEHPWPTAPWGAYSFNGYYALLGIPGIEGFRSADFFNADIVAIGIFNTTDYVAYLTADFGLWGALTISALLGGISAWLFLRAKYTRSIPFTQVLAFFATGLVISVRGFYFGAAGFAVTILLIGAQPILLRTLWPMKVRRNRPLQSVMSWPTPSMRAP